MTLRFNGNLTTLTAIECSLYLTLKTLPKESLPDCSLFLIISIMELWLTEGLNSFEYDNLFSRRFLLSLIFAFIDTLISELRASGRI
jgi:hypothetical protein